jgi:serine/threonine-protein kinase
MGTWTIPAYAGDWAVPGYIEERQLGKGASGRVVAAVHEATGRRVAIKYLSPALVGNPAFMWQFRSEAEVQRSLDVPQVVHVFDYVEAPGRGAAIVMELVNGVSLHEMIEQRGPTGPEAALAVLKGSLLGLAAAHAAGIVHRDYKPENVLVDAEGSSKLADFGVAVQTGKKLPTAGTPLYMAPEQWNGAPSSPATDIYAAAAVFFECLTGKTPFSGRTTRLRQQHESVGVPLDQVPEPALRSLIVRGMAKDPADRPPDAIAFAIELEAVATAAYGADWETRGHGHLAVRAAALLPLLFLGGGTAGSSGTSAATSWLGGRRVLNAGRKVLRTGHRAAPIRRKALALASIGTAVVVVAAVATVALALTGKNHPPTAQLTSASSAAFTTTIQAAVSPPVAASNCAAPTPFSYQGTITAMAPGPVSYRWLYSSGQQGPVQTVDFAAAGHRQVTGSIVQTMTAGTGWAEIQMLSPAEVTSNKASYQLLCGGKAAGISAAGAIQSPSQTMACGTSPPRFTANGFITSRKAQTVTYHWALSDGRSTPPATMTFSGSGKQQAETLLFNPEGNPSSGDAVLVVTSPVAATSAPMPFTVSCYMPLQLAASAAVSPANETLSSCTAAPPVFTFTGEVTDNQAGLLSYYWKLPSGNGPVQTLNFAQAGTQTVTTTYQPSGDNTTGSGAIVVTSPGSATSNATTFTLSCTHSPVPSSLTVTVDLPVVTLARVEQYYGTVTVSGGTGPYTWAAATGLPDGLTAYTRGATLTISGTPTRPGRYLVGVSVRDGESPSRTVTASIPIIVRLPAIVQSLPRLMLTADVPTVAGVGDEEYYGTVTVFGGRGPYQWGPVSGLPDGLTAYANGATLTISGTPVRPGRYLVGVSVRDSERPARTVTESIPIIVRRAPVAPVLPPTLTTCAPEVVTVGDEEYYGTVTVFGGRGPYQWGPVSGLPDGLTAYANGATLTISGTPVRPGHFLVGVSVRDSERPARTVRERIPITVKPGIVVGAPPRITADVPAVATVGEESYSGTATVSGGQGPYTWGPVSGLPDGLMAYANGATLTISGTPTKAGRFLAGVSASDGESPARTVTERIPITVRSTTGTSMPLRITADVPAAATVGQKGYSGTATVSGGHGPYTWAAVSGLPDGLTATANGATLTISGTPTKAGPFTVGVSAGDGESPVSTATASVTVTVRSAPVTPPTTTTPPPTTTPTTEPPTTAPPTTAPPTTKPPTTAPPTTAPPTTTTRTPPLTITTAALPAATWKVPYAVTVIASGGRGLDKWSATGLPSGLTATANGATLTISGTPVLAGALGDPVIDPVTVTVTDSGTPRHRTTRTFSLRVNPPPLTLTGGALTAGTSGAAYSAAVSATGGAGVYKWSATGLPTGLSIGSTTGTITGTAPTVTAATAYTITVTVTDSESPAQTATARFTVMVNPSTPTTSPSTPTTSPSTPTTSPSSTSTGGG